ncbi:MAG: hypothetical protein Q8P24_15345 [Desulfobacterales bacterium]|nr:hypothetical protein [Desulfobacterales bacterium]
MTYHNESKKLSPWKYLPGIIAAILIVLTGCAASKPKPKPLVRAYQPAETIKLHFEKPLIVKTPAHDPQTVEEHIRCALFYYDQGRFSEAADEFGNALQKISDHQTPLYRALLIGSAVCQLLTDNKPGFIKTVQDLKSTYTKYELMVIENKDRRVKAIFNLHDELLKTDKY